MEKLTVNSPTLFIDNSGLEINKLSSRNMFPAPFSQTKVFKESTIVSLPRNQNKATIKFFAKPKKEPSNPHKIEKFCTKVN